MIRDHKEREDVQIGLKVSIVLKKDQRTNKRIVGIVEKLLTSSSFHPRGIKVRLESGDIGRVQGFI